MLYFEYTMLAPHPLPLSVSHALGPFSGLFHHNFFCLSDCICCLSPSLCSGFTDRLAVPLPSTLPSSYLKAFALAVRGAPSLTSFRSPLRCYLLLQPFLTPVQIIPLVHNMPEILYSTEDHQGDSFYLSFFAPFTCH